MLSVEAFLENKPLFYSQFDPFRMQKAYKSIQEKLSLPKIIHIIGTNGKGTTGRYLAQMLMQSGYSVGHYTSPHIEHFNERIWLNGKNIDADALQKAFVYLQNCLDIQWQERLSYFEYTTLLALVAYQSCDYVVLEAGLGGEFDATSVFENNLTVITPIGMDHQEFLGDTLEAIVTSKLNAIQKDAVVAVQPNASQKIVKHYFEQKRVNVYYVKGCDISIKPLDLAYYLKQNMQTAFTAYKALGLTKAIDFSKLQTLEGRFYLFKDNIRIDVGHNPLAAEALAQSLGKSKVILVYNSFSDKQYDLILKILKPNILHVEIMDVDDERIVKRAVLEKKLQELNLAFTDFTATNPNNDYLVFGSFSVVEAFLMRYNG